MDSSKSEWHELLCDFAESAHNEPYPPKACCRKYIRQWYKDHENGLKKTPCPGDCCRWDCRYRISDKGPCECYTTDKSFFECNC